MNVISKRAVVLGVVASLGFAGTARAATDDTSATITGATIALTPPAFGDFPGTTLNGSAQSKVTTVSGWSVNDPRGNGLGWEVTVDASDLSTGGGSPIIMTGGVLTVTAPVATPVDPTNVSTAPTTVGGDISTGSVKVVDAGVDQGLGDWSLAQGAADLSLAVPANARAGTYTSTITTTLTPGV